MCKVGEFLVLDCLQICVCVRNLHDIQHAPNTQLAEIHLIVQNVCRICLVAPEFLSVCVNQCESNWLRQ